MNLRPEVKILCDAVKTLLSRVHLQSLLSQRRKQYGQSLYQEFGATSPGECRDACSSEANLLNDTV